MKKSEPVERVPESRSARSGTGGTQSSKKNRVPEPAERRNAKKIHKAFRRNAGTQRNLIKRSGGTLEREKHLIRRSGGTPERQKKNLVGTQKSRFCPERVPKHPWF